MHRYVASSGFESDIFSLDLDYSDTFCAETGKSRHGMMRSSARW